MGSNVRGMNAKISRRRSCGKKMAGFSVRMRVKKLQKIIPGSQGSNPDKLLLQTADYILFLRLQINVLQTLNNLHVQ